MNTRLLGFILGIITVLTVQAQDHQISFTATGASTIVDSVKVENITQCTTINIDGDDILNLVAALNINDPDAGKANSAYIFPNPFKEYCTIEFEVPVSGIATIQIADINGKLITRAQNNLQKGLHTYKLSGIYSGIYVVRLIAETYTFTRKIISNYKGAETPDIVLQSTMNAKTESQKHSNTKDAYDEKGITSTIQMQYNTGDIIKLTGKSGIYRTVYMIVPTTSQAVCFTFIPCTDNNGNNYSVVKIGEQWWMAENLNSGTFASITSPQASGTKFCMDINGQEDPTCPMGGLYEWDNLMQGASFCNGTGAYPNDRCDTPVQGLCPNGWHIPSHFEWNTLSANSGDSPSSFPYNMSLGVYGLVEGGNLKAKCTTDWWSPNLGATNKTGFSAIPGGDTWDNVFEDFGQSSYFWTSTATDYIVYYTPWVYALNYSVSSIGRSEYVKENGFSVRCVKD